jgi:Flp pilus assembly protein TadB
MGIGVRHIHGLSAGAAAGVAVISGVVVILLVVIVAVTLGVLFPAILVGSRGVPR